ncbi:DUF4097 family beta strand repeat-containing protein [candidate division KSB1 bacterium]
MNKNIRNLIILAVLLILFTNTDSIAATAKRQYKRTVAVSGRVCLMVNTRYSDITVLPWNNRQIRIEALITAQGRSYKEAEEFVNKILIRTAVNDTLLKAETILPDFPIKETDRSFWNLVFGSSHDFSVNISFQIFVPEDTDLDITTSDGKIFIDNISGRIRAVTNGKDIELRRMRGLVSAYTTDAKIIADFLNIEGKGIELTTKNGDIEFAIPEDAKITLHSESYHGSISCELPFNKYGPFSDEEQFAWINGGGGL